MKHEQTPVELKPSQLEIGDEPRDTPLAATGTRVANRVVWGFAATTQILNPAYLALDDYALVSRNMTGPSELESIQETEPERRTQEIPTGEPFPAPITAAEIANRDRLELLARAYVARKLSPEEDARLAIVTERVRRLIPRVTVDDFEQLQRIAENVRRIEAEDNERRRGLGLL